MGSPLQINNRPKNAFDQTSYNESYQSIKKKKKKNQPILDQHFQISRCGYLYKKRKWLSQNKKNTGGYL